MRGILYLVSFCWLFVFSLSQDKETKDPDEPEFPDVTKLIENGFYSQIEITVDPERETVFVGEYFSVGEKKTRIDILRNGLTDHIYFYPETKQIATIKNHSCNVVPAGSSNELLDPIFKDWLYSKKDDPNVYFGPTSLLRLAADNTPMYMKTETVRGIDCQKFNGPHPFDDEISIDYYFTDPLWTTPVNVTKKVRLPVKIVLYGTGQPEKGSPSETFIQTIDYVLFQPYIYETRVLKPPTGYGCLGLINQGPSIPPITEHFTMFGEELKEQESGLGYFFVNTFRLWYDYTHQLARIDKYTKDDRGVSTVLDFNTGLMYVTTDGETCSALTISDEHFETFSDDLTGRMMKPGEVFKTDGAFYHLGTTYIRGIICDIYESVRINMTMGDVLYSRVVFTYYFSADLWEIEVEGTQEKQIPIRLEINRYIEETGKPASQNIQNFFGFNKHPVDDYKVFSIEGCAGAPSEKSYFEITFSEDPDDVNFASSKASEFQDILRDNIVESAGISYLRLPFLRVDFEPETITVLGLILERVPVMDQFTKLGQLTNPTKLELKVGKVKDENACADECVKMDGCTGFHYCPSTKDCFVSLMRWGEEWGDELDIDKCDIYVRTEKGSNTKNVALKDALSNLDKAVNKDKTLTVTLPREPDTIEFEPDEFIPNVSPFPGDHYSDMYEVVLGQKTLDLTSKTSKDGGKLNTVGDCYRKCREEVDIMCSSFSFCVDTFQCTLSSALVTKEKSLKDDVADNTRCNVYTISFLQMFEEYSGRVPGMPGKKEMKNVESEKECAKNCRQEDSFICRGFDYCSEKNTCELHEKHVLDMGIGVKDDAVSCSHYALKYAADYSNLGNTLAEGEDSKNIASVTLEQCAKLCSEDTGFNCKTFNYCPSDTSVERKCTLNTVDLNSDGAKLSNSETCIHYMKKDVVDDWINPRNVEKDSSPPEGGYSPSGLAALIIGILILGIVVGIIGFLGFSYYKSRPDREGITVKFSKHEDA